jgi:hypothetical protein
MDAAHLQPLGESATGRLAEVVKSWIMRMIAKVGARHHAASPTRLVLADQSTVFYNLGWAGDEEQQP